MLYRIAGKFRIVQNFAFFTDRLVVVKKKNREILNERRNGDVVMVSNVPPSICPPGLPVLGGDVSQTCGPRTMCPLGHIYGPRINCPP